MAGAPLSSTATASAFFTTTSSLNRCLGSRWSCHRACRLCPTPFTLPAALRPVAYRHPTLVYDVLFAAANATLKTFALNDPRLHANIGATAVLHTHTRRLDYHPHVHVIVPGGAIDARRRQWRKLKGRYLFNAKALAVVFRAKCLEAFNRAGLALPEALPAKWIVHCKRVGKGLPALKYLARYLYRGVVSEDQLVDYNPDTQEVTWRYRDSKTGQYRQRTLALVEFVWRLMIHVLPKGYRRVRDYGLLHSNAKRLRTLVQGVLRVVIPPPAPAQPRVFQCPGCGAAMHALGFYHPRLAPP